METLEAVLDGNAFASMRANGYLHLPDALDPEVVRSARRAINVDLGVNGLDASRYSEYESSSFCPAIRDSAVIHDLVRCPGVWPAIEQFFGPGRAESPSRTQIALRFPDRSFDSTDSTFPVPHVDGFPHPLNKIPSGTVKSYSLLVACHLSDTVVRDSGNFSVWPGTHLKNSAKFASSGADSFDGGRSRTDGSWRQPIFARAGDVTFMHYLLGHHPFPNLSADVRYTVFFRVSTRGLQDRWRSAIVEPWSEWQGMNNEVGVGR